MSRPLLILASTAAHVALVVALGSVEVERSRAATSIEMFEAPPEPPPAAPEPPPPVVEPEAPEPERAPRPKAAAEAPPEEAPASPLDSLPNLGLELGGATGEGGAGGGGFAVRQGTGPRNGSPVVRKTLAPATRVEPKPSECAEPAGKPKLLDLPRPAYSEEARAMGVEGKVRVRITVDEHGNVVSAEVLEGLGHGLDEAALAATRAARFEPGLQCGKAVSSTFTVSIRFSAA